MDYADNNPDTLVIITADHETSGLTLLSSNDKASDPYKNAGHHYSSAGHTVTMVPVYAYGNGAERFSGVYENTEIFHKRLKLISGLSHSYKARK